MKHFYDSLDVMQLLNLNSKRTAQNRIKSLNDDLKKLGYWTEAGKVPISLFHEKYPYIKNMEVSQ